MTEQDKRAEETARLLAATRKVNPFQVEVVVIVTEDGKAPQAQTLSSIRLPRSPVGDTALIRYMTRMAQRAMQVLRQKVYPGWTDSTIRGLKPKEVQIVGIEEKFDLWLNRAREDSIGLSTDRIKVGEVFESMSDLARCLGVAAGFIAVAAKNSKIREGYEGEVAYVHGVVFKVLREV